MPFSYTDESASKTRLRCPWHPLRLTPHLLRIGLTFNCRSRQAGCKPSPRISIGVFPPGGVDIPHRVAGRKQYVVFGLHQGPAGRVDNRSSRFYRRGCKGLFTNDLMMFGQMDHSEVAAVGTRFAMAQSEQDSLPCFVAVPATAKRCLRHVTNSITRVPLPLFPSSRA